MIWKKPMKYLVSNVMRSRVIIYILVGLFSVLYFVFNDFFVSFLGKKNGFFMLSLGFFWFIPGKHSLLYFAPLYFFLFLWFRYYELFYMFLFIFVIGFANLLNYMFYNKDSTLTFGGYFFIDFLYGNIKISWYDILLTVVFLILLILAKKEFEIFGNIDIFWIEGTTFF